MYVEDFVKYKYVPQNAVNAFYTVQTTHFITLCICLYLHYYFICILDSQETFKFLAHFGLEISISEQCNEII